MPRNVDSPDNVGAVPAEGNRARSEWTQMADCIERFCLHWDQQTVAPDLSQYVPGDNTRTSRLTLIELVKVDLEQRWTRGREPRGVEHYLERWPELAEPDGSPSCDLVYEEFHIRRQTGEQVRVSEFGDRFPSLADRLRRLISEPEVSSMMCSGSRAKITLTPGESIDDFDVLTHLGSGAFATVYLARQRSMQRLCALKVSTTRSNEAQTLAQLDHPNIVRVYDQRILPEKNLRLLYMQYVAGSSVAEIIDSLRLLPPAQWSGKILLKLIDEKIAKSGTGFSGQVALNEHPLRRRLQHASWPETVCLLGIQLASALECAHGHGVLHRDLKPANVLLDEHGSPKLVDFNISFCSKLDGVTPAAYFGGSLAYMSPEQLEACHPDNPRDAGDIDSRSDQFSLSVLLWELLSGQRPFLDHVSASNWLSVLADAVDLRAWLPDHRILRQLPYHGTEPLIPVLLRGLTKDRDQRFTSAAEMARELRFCTEPAMLSAVRPAAAFWRDISVRWPMTVIATIVIAANAAAARVNFLYNQSQIIDKLPDAGATFLSIQFWINLIAFTAGLAIGTWIAWPVIKAVRNGGGGHSEFIRRRCLSIGNLLALLGAFEWLLAGAMYPIALRIAGVPLSADLYAHFFVSLALCGAIAATYPFFLITWLAVRSFYPRLLTASAISSGEIESLRSIHRLTWHYLALAAALPLVGVMLFVFLADGGARWVLGVLSVTGLVGFAVLFVVARSLQSSLSLLADVIEITNDPNLVRTDSMRVRM